MNPDKLRTLYMSMRDREQELDFAYFHHRDHPNDLDAQLKWDAAWATFWIAKCAFDDYTREYRMAMK